MAAYESTGFALVRTPTLPVEAKNQMFEEGTPSYKSLRMAIAVSSPTLINQMLKHDNTLEDANVTQKMNSYQTRMSLRPTPFGLFAGVALAKFGKSTNLETGGISQVSTRPDMGWLTTLIEKLESDKECRRQLRYFPNAELFSVAERVWVENAVLKNGKRFSSSLVNNEAVSSALTMTKNGLNYNELSRSLAESFRVPLKRAEDLCDELCSSNILVSELRFPLNTVKLFEKFLSSVSQLSGLDELQKNLYSLAEMYESWPNKSDPVKKYSAMCEHANTIQPGSKDVCQVDASILLKGDLVSNRVSKLMAEAAEIFLRLNPPADWLSTYKTQFRWRYPFGREVPLLELLSPRFGLGSPYAIATHQNQVDLVRNKLLISIATRALQQGRTVIELTTKQMEDLQGFQLTTGNTPSSLDLFASIAAASRKDIDDGKFKLVVSNRVGDIGATRSLGRFTSLLGPDSLDLMSSVAELESDPDFIAADIDSWPLHTRHANVSQAPPIRKYIVQTMPSIAYDTRILIPLSEIVIGLENEKFYALWTKDGRKIRVCPAHLLHSSHLSEPARFLMDLAVDGLQHLAPLDWGSAADFPVLPRLEYRNIVIKPAQWNLQELWNSCEDIGNFQSFRMALDLWRKTWHVPTLVQVTKHVQDDNILMLDLDRMDDIYQLWSLTKKFSVMLAQEYIPTSDWHSTDNGHFATELVASFVLKDQARNRPHSLEASRKAKVPIAAPVHLRPPGSEWIYLRLESAFELHNEIIVKLLSLASKLKSKKLIQEWFFIRYHDQKGGHLRVRFRLVSEALALASFKEICCFATELTTSRVCQSFTFETYDREVERYGGASGIAIVESIFAVDSESLPKVISLKNFSDTDPLSIAVLSVNELLTGLGLTVEERITLLSESLPLNYRRTISDGYRSRKVLLCKILSHQDMSGSEIYHDISRILTNDFVALDQLVTQLKVLSQTGELTMPLRFIFDSIVHMHCIRLLGLDRNLEFNVRALLCNTLNSLKAMSEKKVDGLPTT
jgi:thiopeptide-type bacteriocin biosynthesis protein